MTVAGISTPCINSRKRLLVPVKRGEEARQAVHYAIRCCAAGTGVEICFLHVEEGSRSAARLPRRNQSGPQAPDAFGRSVRLLDGIKIDHAAYMRTGPVVFAILDAAEELDCDEIILPKPRSGLARFLSRGVVERICACQRSVPVIAVDDRGLPAD